VCHYCREGHISKDQLALFLNKVHKNCKGCTRDEQCPAEKDLSEDDSETLNRLREEVADYRAHKDTADHQRKLRAV